MQLLLQPPKKALNKAYLKEKVGRAEIELFKKTFSAMLSRIDEAESEEHGKNIVADFLKDTWYKQHYEINTKDRKDLVIHTGKTAKEAVGVILEVKKPGNKAEMISVQKPNAKALQELILYYLRERIDGGNKFIRHLIITNIYEWYIIDERWAEQYIYGDTRLRKDYEDFKASGKNTSFFYDSIARPFIDALQAEIPCIYFDIRDYRRIIENADKADDNKLIALYKILSPVHLLKEKFANDSNSLDKGFYEELLHLIGLEEVTDDVLQYFEKTVEEIQALKTEGKSTVSLEAEIEAKIASIYALSENEVALIESKETAATSSAARIKDLSSVVSE